MVFYYLILSYVWESKETIQNSINQLSIILPFNINESTHVYTTDYLQDKFNIPSVRVGCDEHIDTESILASMASFKGSSLIFSIGISVYNYLMKY